MYAVRNIKGNWVIRFKGSTYYTFSTDFVEAMDYVLNWEGKQPEYV